MRADVKCRTPRSCSSQTWNAAEKPNSCHAPSVLLALRSGRPLRRRLNDGRRESGRAVPRPTLRRGASAGLLRRRRHLIIRRGRVARDARRRRLGASRERKQSRNHVATSRTAVRNTELRKTRMHSQ